MLYDKDKRLPVGGEIHLRRLTIDEASLRLDKYLDNAFMAGISRVRIVHGKGTGILRNAIHRQLGSHPLIKSYRLGVYGEGGAGVTIAELVYR